MEINNLIERLELIESDLENSNSQVDFVYDALIKVRILLRELKVELELEGGKIKNE